MKIGILGTRGIPNNYGGFEQCAEYLASGIVKEGHNVTVYNSHNHSYKRSEWNGVHIVHCYDPEFKMGTFGQFIYDLNCIIDSRKRNFDLILQLGYSSSSIWGWLLPRKPVVITNMDGLEWKRSKYSKPTQFFLRIAEHLSVIFSDYLIADSIGIQNHLLKKYNRQSTYIPYGATLVEEPDISLLDEYNVLPDKYHILIARMEPENNIQTILDGVIESGTQIPILVIGGVNNKYARWLIDKYRTSPNIIFLGALYDIKKLNSLRYYSALYFHGHSVGGTNPSLLEAMACGCLICANENEFNRAILENDAYYFQNSGDIARLLSRINYENLQQKDFINNNRVKIRNSFNWEKIVHSYLEHFIDIVNSGDK